MTSECHGQVFLRRLRLLPLLLASALAPLCAAQNITLTLANSPPVQGTVSTRNVESMSMSVLSGSRVSFARSSGRDYRLQASGGFFWTQVQELPMDSDAVALTPVLREDGSLEVTIELARKFGVQEQRFNSTLVAIPGEWIRLFGPAETASRGTRVYGTQTLDDDALYLLLEP